jgi:hypothetical protein
VKSKAFFKSYGYILSSYKVSKAFFISYGYILTLYGVSQALFKLYGYILSLYRCPKLSSYHTVTCNFIRSVPGFVQIIRLHFINYAQGFLQIIRLHFNFIQSVRGLRLNFNFIQIVQGLRLNFNFIQSIQGVLQIIQLHLTLYGVSKALFKLHGYILTLYRCPRLSSNHRVTF